MDAIAIYCKGCDALFYATSRILADDVLEIAELAKLGHRVAKVDPVEVKLNLRRCSCDWETNNLLADLVRDFPAGCDSNALRAAQEHLARME